MMRSCISVVPDFFHALVPHARSIVRKGLIGRSCLFGTFFFLVVISQHYSKLSQHEIADMVLCKVSTMFIAAQDTIVVQAFCSKEDFAVCAEDYPWRLLSNKRLGLVPP